MYADADGWKAMITSLKKAARVIGARSAIRAIREIRGEIIAVIACALLFPGCSTYDADMSRFEGPLKPYTPDLAFDTKQTRKSIEAFLASRTAKNGLVASFTMTAPYTFSTDTGRFHECLYGRQGYLDDQAFTYDLSLAVIGLMLSKQHEQAEKILDALQKDFYLPKNGKSGLYNSYLVSSRIPVDELQLGSDGDRIHTGPTLWVALAALNHAKLARNTKYLDFVLDIVVWCRSELTYYRFPDGERGGVSMGMGWGPTWAKIFSTEHNVDYFAVLQMLHHIYEESPNDVRKIFHDNHVEDGWLLDEMAHVGRWIKEVAFDPEEYIFRAGVNQFGVDQLRILDGTSWGLGGVGPENYEAWGIDIDRLIESTEKHFIASHELPNGDVLYGFDITDPDGYERARDPLIWFEGTGQQIIAYGELGRYYAKKGDVVRARRYAGRAARYTRFMNTFSDFYGMRGSLPYMSIRPDSQTIVKTLKWEWEIPRGKDSEHFVGSISSTMWFLYCINGFYNPMQWN